MHIREGIPPSWLCSCSTITSYSPASITFRVGMSRKCCRSVLPPGAMTRVVTCVSGSMLSTTFLYTVPSEFVLVYEFPTNNTRWWVIPGDHPQQQDHRKQHRTADPEPLTVHK
eukprot:Sspe_Gene.60985::Locus_33718_Transcript_1_2_Confidence_0.750_Length_1912::g.60985::m.60985